MPTGYTCGVQNGEATELKDYILQCARNFGACIHMRDEDFKNKPKLREVNDYYLKQLERANKELEEYKLKTDEDFYQEMIKTYKRRKEEKENYLKEKEIHKQRYSEMLEKVKNWKPPTEDHIKLREFAIKQLECSIDFDCGCSSWLEPTPMPTLEEYKQIELNCIVNSIKRYSESYQAEVENTIKANKWITDLYESLEGEE